MGDVDLLVSEQRSAADRDGDGRHRLRRSVHDSTDTVCTSRVTRSRRAVSASTSTTRSRSRFTRSWRRRCPCARSTSPRACGPAGRGRAQRTIPTSAALLLHLLLHAAGNMRAHALRQIQLHDIAMVAAAARRRTIGARCWSRRRGDERAWWVFPPLALAARYYPTGAFRRSVLRAARAACPRVLRLATERQSLTDVSWSNLHIHAFPGIAWSRTPLDALRFMRSRALPSRRSLAELRVQLGALSRSSRAVPWYGLAHGRRILRWLFSQPPRVQTMVSVRAALESAAVTKADSDSQHAPLVLPLAAHVRHRDGLRRRLDGWRRCAAVSARVAERRHPRARAEPAKFCAHGRGRSAQTRGHSSLAGRGQRPPIRGAVVRRRCGLRSRARFGAPRHELPVRASGLDST